MAVPEKRIFGFFWKTQQRVCWGSISWSPPPAAPDMRSQTDTLKRVYLHAEASSTQNSFRCLKSKNESVEKRSHRLRDSKDVSRNPSVRLQRNDVVLILGLCE